ncbi:MAG: hypothetical protein Tsb0017_02110 [Geothermobacteraceae bacterium]
MWENKPVLLLVLATVTILVGTVITMVLPFAWVNTDRDRIETVTPYNPLELAGRDVYIREGCNNCHSQTVRPLVTEVLRYGDYSKSGEFAYDQPHLWGSRRMGPDLARIGGKYPDAWHYKHMHEPKSMVPKTNMPAYAFLEKNKVDPDETRHKMDVLGFPYTEADIKALQGKTEMDAMVAYLQKLGTGIDWRKQADSAVVGELVNPFRGDKTAAEAGESLYRKHCAACHGQEREGDIGPELTGLAGMDDGDLFEILYNGLPDGGMPAFSNLGATKNWQLVNYLLQED